MPVDGTLNIELYGELSAFLGLANEHPRSRGTGAQITLVAGTCCNQDPTIIVHV